MDAQFLILLLLPSAILGNCPAPYVPVGTSCLYFETLGTVMYPEPRQLCHAANGELATILTPTQHKAIADYIFDTGLDGRNYWLDGADEAEVGVWVTSTGISLPMGTPFWEAHMNYQQPDNGHERPNCMAIQAEYMYYIDDDECTDEQNAICETPILLQNMTSLPISKTIDCPLFYVDVGGKCLAFMTWADETWDSARQACIGLQGELASIEDVELLRAVYLYLHQEGLADHSFWLGGTDSYEEGSWVWLDGSQIPMGTPFWGMNLEPTFQQEPNGGTLENCLALLAEGYHYFRDAECLSQLANPLCQYNPLGLYQDFIVNKHL